MTERFPSSEATALATGDKFPGPPSATSGNQFAMVSELLFDRMPMGIAILDRSYRILRYNPTWEDFSARYAPPGGAPLRPGVGYFDHLPGAEPTVMPLYQRVVAGETIRQDEVCLELAGRASYWDITLTPLTEGGEVVGILNVSVDVTERVLARQTLEQRVEERTREVERRRQAAESLRDIIGMINAHIPLDAFLDRAVQVAAQQLGAGACVLHHFDLDNQMVEHLAGYGLEGIFEKGGRRPFSALKPSGGEHYLRAALQQQPTYGNYPPLPERLEEIRRDPTIPEAIKAERIALRRRFAGSFSVPLFIQDKVYGGLVFYYTEPQDFNEEQIQLGLTFAEQMAVAIENARLLAETQQRREVAESLRDTLSKINSGGSLDEVLDFIVAQADQLSASRFVALYVLADSQDLLAVRALRGQFPEAMRQVRLRPGEGAVGRAVAERRIMIISDVEKIGYAASVEQIDERRPVYIQQDHLEQLQQVASAFKAVLAIPLLTKNRTYGALAFYYPAPHQFQPDEVQLASAFADQAALAIENALLREQSAQAAILAERNRLARDLHDAVTQTLFSASLIADVLPRLWERNPEAGRLKLEELRLLTRGALSEMRTLLLELRPDTLADVELGDLCRHLVNAFSGRTRVPVTFTQEGQATLPPQVKETFYRVVQEALNNIAKHANASQVELLLALQPARAEVIVRDDGDGFDLATLAPENLGLAIMRERAAAIGARLTVESQPAAGTRVAMVWEEKRDT